MYILYIYIYVYIYIYIYIYKTRLNHTKDSKNGT